MIHFWGAHAIAQRLGFKNVKSFYLAYAQGRVAAYRRRDPKDSRRVLWYSNESLFLMCELSMAKQQHERWRAEQEAAREITIAKEHVKRWRATQQSRQPAKAGR